MIMTNLFSEFQKVDRQQWLEKAISDLKGKNPDEIYGTDLTEEIKQLPYYDQSNFPGSGINISPLKHHRPYDPWFNTQYIKADDEKTSNQIGIKSLKSGCNGLHFAINKDSVDFELLLKDISLPYCWIALESNDHATFKNFLDQTVNSEAKSEVQMALMSNNLVAADAKSINTKLDITDQFREYQNIKTLQFNIPLANPQDTVKQLAVILNEFVEIITNSENFSIFELFNRVIIKNTCTNTYFFEICKLRAIRILFHRIATAYDQPAAPVFIQSHTSEETDELKMLLSNTTQAMSAIIGGSDALVVHSNEKTPTEHSQRIARNVSCLLAEESHLDKVNDPASGSYYLDSLTYQIVEQVWKQFLVNEKKGGILQSTNKH